MNLSPCRHCGINHSSHTDLGRCKESAKDYIAELEGKIAAANDAIQQQGDIIREARGKMAPLHAIAAGHRFQACLVCKGATRYKHHRRGVIDCDSCGAQGYFVVEPWKPSGLNNWNNGTRGG